MRALMLVISNVAADIRVIREATTLAAAGHLVHIIGKDVPAEYIPPNGVTFSSVGKPSALCPAPGRVLPAHLRALRWVLLPQHRNATFRAWTKAARLDAARREFDVVHAHDFTTLLLGSRLAAEHGAPLVYDSHEYWAGRPRVGRPTPVQTARETRVERELGAAAAAVLTVGEGVAEKLRERHGWQYVTVVRNTFPLVMEGEPIGPPTAAVYAGRIAPYRELETLVAAARRIPDLPVTIIGPADQTYLATFDPGPVRVLPPVPPADIGAVLRGAGLSLVTHSDRWENHRLALPNKLFQAVAAGVPVVATDVGELRRIVRQHNLGTLYRPGNPGSLIAAIAEARSRYAELTESVHQAAPVLCWEHDAAALVGVYDKLVPG